MILTYANGKFILCCSYHERDVPKRAGFYWDPFHKHWCTDTLSRAARFQAHADERAKNKFYNLLIRVKPWAEPIEFNTAQKPYPFQIDAARFALSRNRAYLALEMGTGKTPVAAMIAASLRQNCLYICPPFLVENTLSIFERWLPKNWLKHYQLKVVPDSMVYKPNNEKFFTLGTLTTGNWFLVADECFNADTLVDTPGGPKPIKAIKIGDKVLNCFGVDTVKNVFKRDTPDEIVKISFNDSFVFCSKNHPFFTERGWINAEKLQLGDKLFSTNETVCLVQNKISENFPILDAQRCVLRQQLLVEAQKKYMESDVLPKNSEKIEQHFKTDRAQTTNTRGQWAGFNLAGKNLAGFFAQKFRFLWARCHKNRGQTGVSKPLQDRYRASENQNSYRGRRAESQCIGGESPRQEENETPCFFRGEGVEVQKRGNFNGFKPGPFYDLEIEKHPSFSVNGVLVHNCHRYKELTAKRTKAVMQLIPMHERAYFLSGTPMPNRPMELYPVLSTAAPETIDFMSRHEYGVEYCDAYYKENFRCWDYSGASNTAALGERVRKNFMLVMKKEDVLKDLPEKTHELVIISATIPPKAAALEKEILKRLSPEKETIPEGVNVANYRRLLGEHKAKTAAEFIRDLLENSNESCLVFAFHRNVIETLQNALLDFRPYVITGDTPVSERQAIVNEFQKNDRKVLIGNYLACGVGFTLTKATRVVFVEYSWVPGENAQAADRTHRIGQKNPVTVQYLVHKNSFDRQVLETVLRKQKNITNLERG